MTRFRFPVLVLSFLVAACSGRKGSAPGAAADSSHAPDSSSQSSGAVPAHGILSYEERQGGVLYMKYCAVCHGKEGKGDGFNAFNLDPRPRDFSDSAYMAALSDEQIVQTIVGGGRSINKSPLMPSYGWTIDGREIRYVAAYVRALGAGAAPRLP